MEYSINEVSNENLYLTVNDIEKKYDLKLHQYNNSVLVLNITDTTILKNLAKYYRYELKNNKNYELFLQSACKLNDTEAMEMLGFYYLSFKLKNYELAITYFITAYENGNTKTAFNVGAIYDKCFKKYDDAKIWYLKGYNHGCTKCICNLALLYKKHENNNVLMKKLILEGVEKNCIKSLIIASFHLDLTLELVGYYFLKAIEINEKEVIEKLKHILIKSNKKNSSKIVKKVYNNSKKNAKNENDNEHDNEHDNNLKQNDNEHDNNLKQNDNEHENNLKQNVKTKDENNLKQNVKPEDENNLKQNVKTEDENNLKQNDKNEDENNLKQNDKNEDDNELDKLDDIAETNGNGNFKNECMDLYLSYTIKSHYKTLLSNITSISKYYEVFHLKGAMFGFIESMYSLGYFYEKINPSLSTEYYNLGINNGCSKCLNKIFPFKERKSEAYKKMFEICHLKSVENNNSESIISLFIFYYRNKESVKADKYMNLLISLNTTNKYYLYIIGKYFVLKQYANDGYGSINFFVNNFAIDDNINNDNTNNDNTNNDNTNNDNTNNDNTNIYKAIRELKDNMNDKSLDCFHKSAELNHLTSINVLLKYYLKLNNKTLILKYSKMSFEKGYFSSLNVIKQYMSKYGYYDYLKNVLTEKINNYQEKIANEISVLNCDVDIKKYLKKIEFAKEYNIKNDCCNCFNENYCLNCIFCINPICLECFKIITVCEKCC